MVQILLIGIGAGAATALLFASVASGSALSVLLFYLAPLPILIEAMGWSHWAALVAALFASASLAAVFGSFFFISFLIGIGLPAWWLGYLALLARPAASGAPNALEWYPVGHLVFWAAIISAAIVAIGIFTLGGDEEGFRTTLRKGVERALRAQGITPESLSGGSRFDTLLDIMVAAMPVAGAALTTITGVVNLGLAARVVKLSGRLQRPWPELSAMTFPSYAPAVMGVAVVGSLIAGMPGLMSSVLLASLLVAYAVLGFAVLHSITRGINVRPFLLGSAYASVIVLFWPAIMMTMLGLADTAFDLRGRAAGRRGPPNPNSQI